MLEYITHPPARGVALGSKAEDDRRRCVGYVSDPSAVDGAVVLFDQKRSIDGYAAVRGVPVQGYVVDSGTRSSDAGIAHGLRGLICAVHRGDVDAVVVEHISRFAPDYALALRIAAALSSWGATVHEARGGPTIVSHALAASLAADAFPDQCGGSRVFHTSAGERSLGAGRSH